MKKHKINCHHCDQEFESERSDAKYCSDSCKTRASQIRLKENPVIKSNMMNMNLRNYVK